ncbi:hypothetical protein [Pseudaquabacterium rugosum]|uniref:Uncharacterized protein n=1 Tax=Pseudaquabacterium rugosum TaxID=2984194 RepID=A0ABU9BFC2_9BURK
MKHPLRILHLFAIAVLAPPLTDPAFAQAPAASLDRLVPTERQVALGLDKLSPEQRAGVVRLLQEAYQLGVQNGKEQGAGGRAAPQSPAPSPQTPSVIETQVSGDFNGWEGETIVKLMNGQIWQQTEYHYYYHYSFMPKALIFRSGGGYKMKIDGIDKAVGVQRLR